MRKSVAEFANSYSRRKKVLSLSWLVVMTAASSAQEQRIAIQREWTGRIAEEQNAHGPKSMVIANAKQWEQLWKAYKLGDDLPKIDFTKSLVLVAASDSAQVRFSKVTLDNGDLKTRVFSTDDLRSDYAYHIIQIPRDGIKTAFGKPVEKWSEAFEGRMADFCNRVDAETVHVNTFLYRQTSCANVKRAISKGTAMEGMSAGIERGHNFRQPRRMGPVGILALGRVDEFFQRIMMKATVR